MHGFFSGVPYGDSSHFVGNKLFNEFIGNSFTKNTKVALIYIKIIKNTISFRK